MDPIHPVRTAGPTRRPCIGTWGTQRKQTTRRPCQGTGPTPQQQQQQQQQQGSSQRTETPIPRGTRDSNVDKESSGANRERSRVRAMRAAFLALQKSLPAVPPDTKLSKLDVLLLASAYIAHLSRTLGVETGRPYVDGVPPAVAGPDHVAREFLTRRMHGATKGPQSLHQDKEQAEARATGNFPGFLHPMKKWPMRSRLYEGITTTARLPSLQNCQDGRERAQPTFLA
ncbi:transcription factor 23-like [Lampetra planeri]